VELKHIIDSIRERLHEDRVYSFYVERETLKKLCLFLRDEPKLSFDMFIDVTAIDYPERDERFELVYHLYSTLLNKRIKLKVRLPREDAKVSSLTDVWQGANWAEREVYDLFGIVFTGHPNLKRILLWDGFEGHPLRKDYPLYKEFDLPEAL